MGTRGFITFVVDGETERTVYNHFDSYPDGLGKTMAEFTDRIVTIPGHESTTGIEALKQAVRDMIAVSNDVPPTPEQVEELRHYADTRPGGGDITKDWYWLLRYTQGEPGDIVNARYYQPANDFPLDSLFAEYGYVIDLDREVLEFYVGFQHEPHDRGRFANRPIPEIEHRTTPYYPCALIMEWPLSTPSSTIIADMKRWEAAFNEAYDSGSRPVAWEVLA